MCHGSVFHVLPPWGSMLLKWDWQYSWETSLIDWFVGGKYKYCGVLLNRTSSGGTPTSANLLFFVFFNAHRYLSHQWIIVYELAVTDGKKNELAHKPVQAVEHLLLSALKLLTHLLQCLLINHITAICSILREKILGKILLKPLIIPENGKQ